LNPEIILLPLAVVIGLIMATIFDRGTGTSKRGLAGATISITAEDREERPTYVTTIFLALLMGVLFGGHIEYLAGAHGWLCHGSGSGVGLVVILSTLMGMIYGAVI